jgi:hypothetical protein
VARDGGRPIGQPIEKRRCEIHADTLAHVGVHHDAPVHLKQVRAPGASLDEVLQVRKSVYPESATQRLGEGLAFGRPNKAQRRRLTLDRGGTTVNNSRTAIRRTESRTRRAG